MKNLLRFKITEVLLPMICNSFLDSSIRDRLYKIFKANYLLLNAVQKKYIKDNFFYIIDVKYLFLYKTNGLCFFFEEYPHLYKNLHIGHLYDFIILIPSFNNPDHVFWKKILEQEQSYLPFEIHRVFKTHQRVYNWIKIIKK